ncbi:MAG: RNA polymerase sigma factor [Eubacterium sp.]
MNYSIDEQFDRIYEKLYPAVLSYFRKRTNEDDAEDMVQTTFMKLWAYLPCLEQIKNAKSLVFSIAKHVYCDKMRQKKLLEISENELFYETESKGDFTKQIEMQMLVSVLPQKDRELIELRRMGCSSREIGKTLGISASAVRSRLQELRKKLKELK